MPKSFSLGFLNSIRAKLIFAFLGVSLAPLILVTIITSNQNQKDLSALVGENFAGASILIEYEIENWVGERKQDIQTLATLTRIRSMDPDQANKAIQDYSNLLQIYETMFLADLNGDTIAINAGNRVNIKDRSYFQQALQGETVVSELLISRASGNPIIVFATPVYQDDKIVGVAGVTVPTTYLRTAHTWLVW